MAIKVFLLPKRPDGTRQCVAVNKPSNDSVWYLLLNDATRTVPLVTLKSPRSARQVIETAAKEKGESFVAQFVSDGYSDPEVMK